MNNDVRKSIAESWKRVCAWHRATLQDCLIGLHISGEPNLMATCFEILGSECCGELDSLNQDQKDRLAVCIQETQDSETGFFSPGELDRGQLSSHSASYIRMQATYFSIHALNALGEKPLFPVRIAEKLSNADFAEGWIDAGNWRNPWLQSNNVMFALTFLQASDGFTKGAGFGQGRAFDAILDYLDDRQDSISGMWQPDDGRDDRNAAFAAYHFFPYFYFRGREPKFQAEAIDTLISLMQPDGFFGYGVGKSGACEDLDVIHSLVLLSTTCQHRKDDIQELMHTTLQSHFGIQNSDGGFPNYLKYRVSLREFAKNPGMIKAYCTGRAQRWRYSGWTKLDCLKGCSDTWGGWFRPLSMKLISGYLFEQELCQSGQYRALPGLGWHFSTPEQGGS
ncbi:hypothetical protein NHH03_16970 [Stieleria sp. TO1_6]|uniref:hypothetical protein n=1 Tax=Stieleria tagensis TaxID=2956795 RepID=UPI00209B2D92|nr:hypothetical protein [Stieleria tagensis]MCO8123443.1 hypothetical protein [Stieleria tagensis]